MNREMDEGKGVDSWKREDGWMDGVGSREEGGWACM